MASFEDSIRWSRNRFSTEDLKKNPPTFPVIAKVASGHYDRTEASSLYTDTLYLIHGWGAQERLLAKNSKGEFLSIPVDSVHRLAHGNSKSWPHKREGFVTTKELLKKYKPPFPAHFDPNFTPETYNKTSFNMKEFGKFTITEVHHLRYLITSLIDRSGSIYVDNLGTILEFLDIEVTIALGMVDHPELLDSLLQAYKLATDELTCTNKGIFNDDLSKLLGYSPDLKTATSHISAPAEVGISSSRVSARYLPLPSIPPGARTVDTWKEVRKRKPSLLPSAWKPPSPPVVVSPFPPPPPQQLPPTPPPQQEGSIDSQPLYDEGQSEPSLAQAQIPMFSPRMPAVQDSASMNPMFPPKLPVRYEVPSSAELQAPRRPSNSAPFNDFDSELRQKLRQINLKNTENPSHTSESMRDSAKPPKSPKSDSYLLAAPRGLRRAETNVGNNPKTPIAKVPPFKPNSIPKTSALQSSRSDVSDLRSKFQRHHSEPVLKAAPLAPTPSRARIISDSQIQAHRKRHPGSEIQHICDIPKDIKDLSVHDVGACLSLLNFDDFISKFAEAQVDGYLLQTMDAQDFQSLGMKSYEAKKMNEFVLGWRPNIDAS